MKEPPVVLLGPGEGLVVAGEGGGRGLRGAGGGAELELGGAQPDWVGLQRYSGKQATGERYQPDAMLVFSVGVEEGRNVSLPAPAAAVERSMDLRGTAAAAGVAQATAPRLTAMGRALIVVAKLGRPLCLCVWWRFLALSILTRLISWPRMPAPSATNRRRATVQ